MMKFKSLFRRQAPGGGGKGYQQNGKTGATPHQQQQQVSWCEEKADPEDGRITMGIPRQESCTERGDSDTYSVLALKFGVQ